MTYESLRAVDEQPDNDIERTEAYTAHAWFLISIVRPYRRQAENDPRDREANERRKENRGRRTERSKRPTFAVPTIVNVQKGKEGKL